MEDKKITIEELKNSGFIHEEPTPESYHAGGPDIPLGAVLSPLDPPPIIFPDGIGWKQVMLDYGIPEIQFNRNFDTFSCTCYATAKALCLYLFKVYNIKVTMSEMFNAFFAGVVPGRGTSAERAFESFRKNGWVEDKDYPFTESTTQIEFSSRPPQSIILKAANNLTEWDIHYEHLTPATDKVIFEAHKRTPVIVSVFAWARKANGIYTDATKAANHLTLSLERSGNNSIICDSYPKDFKYVKNSEIAVGELFKELEAGFQYYSAHRIWLTPSANKPNILNMFKKIVRDVSGGFWFVKNQKKAAISTMPALLGALADEIGCKTLQPNELNALETYPFFGKN